MTTTIYTDTTALVEKFRQHTRGEDSWVLGRGMRVDQDLPELRPWLDGFGSVEAALVELHATMLRLATSRVVNVPENMTTPAAVLFSLTLAVQHGNANRGRVVPDDVVLACVAHVLGTVHSPTYMPDYSRHLDMARSWMAQACLHAGVEAGAS